MKTEEMQIPYILKGTILANWGTKHYAIYLINS